MTASRRTFRISVMKKANTRLVPASRQGCDYRLRERGKCSVAFAQGVLVFRYVREQRPNLWRANVNYNNPPTETRGSFCQTSPTPIKSSVAPRCRAGLKPTQCLVACLNMFSAEVSPKRYWRGPRSQEMGEKGDYLTLHCHHQELFPLRWAAVKAILMCH